jgi:ABC-2 type transport system permease protein
VNKALLVARWEFLTTITRRTYIFAVVAMPVFYGLITGVAALTGRSVARTASGAPVAVVDRSGFLDLPFAAAQAAKRRSPDRDEDVVPATTRRLPAGPPESLVAQSDLDRALAALSEHRVAAVYVIEPDYLSTGRLTAYSRDTGLFSLPNERRRQTQVTDAIRASLLRTALQGDALARAYAPASNVRNMHVDDKGRIEEAKDALSAAGPFAGSFGVFFMLTMAIFFSAGFLQQATIEDRQNRMIEILLSSLDTDQLLVGKIIGLGAAGLLQVAIYLLLLIVPGMTLLALFNVAVGKLALSLVYFVIGYLLFACLMAGTGVLGRTAQERAQISTIWTLTAASPMFFLGAIAASPNGALARALSFFPLTSPVTMMLRLSNSDVPVVDVVLSIAIGIVSVYLTLRAAARVFRAASLMYGKRPTVPELIRWLRAA